METCRQAGHANYPRSQKYKCVRTPRSHDIRPGNKQTNEQKKKKKEKKYLHVP